MTIPRFKVTAATLIILIALLAGCAPVPDNDPARQQYTQPVAARSSNHISAAFYNCENLFDCKRQPGKQDEDFTPEGKYQYTQQLYRQKLHNIATVLQSLDESTAGELAIAGLAEIENDQVLHDLCAQPGLSKHQYRHICHPGPDPRGINAGFIYDPSLFTLLNEEVIPVIFASGGRSRDILHVYGVLNGDTVDILINHWTSRRNEQAETGEKRLQAANTARAAVNNIVRSRPSSRILVMGDFNDNPTDESIVSGLGAQASKDALKAGQLYDPFIAIYNTGRGTEKFKSEWNLFDQVLMSDAWFNGHGHLKEDNADIYAPDFIKEHSRSGDGAPKRAFKGSRWMDGYSDHFPVFVSFSRN